MSEVKNAKIVSASLGRTPEGLLTAWLTLKYADGGQPFGGYELSGNKAALFILRVLEIAQVATWDELVGCAVRAHCSEDKVYAIGHIIEGDLFSPEDELTPAPKTEPTE